MYYNKDKRRETIRDRAAGSLDVFSPDVVVLPDLLSTAALNEWEWRPLAGLLEAAWQ